MRPADPNWMGVFCAVFALAIIRWPWWYWARNKRTQIGCLLIFIIVMFNLFPLSNKEASSCIFNIGNTWTTFKSCITNEKMYSHCMSRKKTMYYIIFQVCTKRNLTYHCVASVLVIRNIFSQVNTSMLCQEYKAFGVIYKCKYDPNYQNINA